MSDEKTTNLNSRGEESANLDLQEKTEPNPSGNAELSPQEVDSSQNPSESAENRTDCVKADVACGNDGENGDAFCESQIPNEDRENRQNCDGISAEENENGFDCDENGESQPGGGNNARKSKAKNVFWWIVIACLLVICAMLVYGRVVYHSSYAIKGASMTVSWEEDGKQRYSLYTEGKVVYIDEKAEIKRGNVIIVDDVTQDNHPLIKRVVGLGGDRLWLEDGYICVLEKGQTESYVIKEADGAPLSPIENALKSGNLWGTTEENPLIVPDGCVYYAGDNRNNSSDCRHSGAVSLSLVRGTVKGFVPGWYILVLRINGLESGGK